MKHVIAPPVPMRIRPAFGGPWSLVVAVVVTDDAVGILHYIDARGAICTAAGNEIGAFIPGLPDAESEHGDWYPADNVR